MVIKQKMFFLFFSIMLLLTGCGPWHIKGYTRNPFEWADILWEAPVDINSEEEQVFEVPFVKYGKRFSVCYDTTIVASGNEITENDRVQMTFSIGGSVFVDEEPLIWGPVERVCLGNGGDGVTGVYFFLPDDFDLETGGTLKVKFSRIKHLKNVRNPRVVLVYKVPTK
ncbi:MAG: hypothetical protein MJZ25_11660 [Fibrobacter sp.]|nr:hypothetical protein [Fibrobacter sp.]